MSEPMPTYADPELAGLIASMADQPPMTSGVDAAGLRDRIASRSPGRPTEPAVPTVDVTLPDGLRARVHTPEGALDAVVLYLHGGGWTIGSVDTHERATRRLADRSGVVVVALDYRLAPEHPAPAAVDDTVAALEWLATGPGVLGGRPATVVVAGDSAGGTLAALAAARLRGLHAAPDVVAMIYANTDLAATGGSFATEAHGRGLDVEDVRFFNRQWVPDEACWADPRVSPLHLGDLAGMPETIVVTCEHDPLRDQGEEFARRLAVAGVRVLGRRELGMVHNFMLWDQVSPACAAAGERVADDIAAAVRRAQEG